jgi:hypothetical protein
MKDRTLEDKTHFAMAVAEFREAVERRLESDFSLAQAFDNALSPAEGQALASDMVALELSSAGFQVTALLGPKEDCYEFLEDMIPQSIKLAERYARLASRVIPEQDLCDMMPVQLRGARYASDFVEYGATSLAKLCLRKPR